MSFIPIGINLKTSHSCFFFVVSTGSSKSVEKLLEKIFSYDFRCYALFYNFLQIFFFLLPPNNMREMSYDFLMFLGRINNFSRSANIQ